MPRRLYLARHGETDSNFFKIISGSGSISHKKSMSHGYNSSSLNLTGLVQAQLLGRALASANVNIHYAYVSPAERARETADRICFWNNVYNSPLKKVVVPDFVEINFGILEGLNGQKVREKYPDLFKTYREKPSQTVFPEGESVLEAYNRVSRALEAILAEHDLNKNVLIVSHGSPLTFIFVHIFKLDLDNMFHAIRHHNCGLSIIEWEKPRSPKIICMNDIGHLKNAHAKMLKG